MIFGGVRTSVQHKASACGFSKLNDRVDGGVNGPTPAFSLNEHVDDDDWAGELVKKLSCLAQRIPVRKDGWCAPVKDKPEIGQIFVNGTDERAMPQTERRAPPASVPAAPAAADGRASRRPGLRESGCRRKPRQA